MKNLASPTNDLGILAVLHRAGKVWRGLIANTKAPRPVVLAVREFPADRIDRLDAWLDEHQCGAVMCVLPAATVICRNCPLPDAAPDQLQQALRLQAEAHLLGIAPPHRLSMAVLPGSPGESNRTGIILAWPEAAVFEAPATTRPVEYVPDVAALAAIMNGQRPAGTLLWMDRPNGTVALALTHSSGAAFRGTNEESQTNEQWQHAVSRIIAETGLSVGHAGSFVEALVQDARKKAASLGPSDAGLFIPQELLTAAVAKIEGTSADTNWWSQYGIAAGALLARVGPLSALTHLQQAPPVETPSRVKVAMDVLSRPKTAAISVLTCVALLMFGPMAFSAIRLGILKVRFSDVDRQLKAARDSRDQLALYKELQLQKVWPMTKLLADISTNTPLGIELDRINLEGGKDFSVTGTVIEYDKKPPQDVLAAMQDNLRKDAMFSDIKPNWGGATNFGNTYKFDLSGSVTKPYFMPPYPIERDFVWTYAMRRDGDPPPGNKSPKKPDGDKSESPVRVSDSRSTMGDGAISSPSIPDGETDSSAVGDLDQSDNSELPRAITPGPRHAGGRPRTPSDTGLDGGDVVSFDSRDSDGVVAPSAQVPPPITAEQVKAMQLSELQDALNKVATARKYNKGDEKLAERLRNEFDMILTQIRKVKGT